MTFLSKMQRKYEVPTKSIVGKVIKLPLPQRQKKYLEFLKEFVA